MFDPSPVVSRLRFSPVTSTTYRSYRPRRFDEKASLLKRGQRVVDLADDRDPVVGQALDEVHLPQRPVARQGLLGNPRHQARQRVGTTRRGKRDVVQVGQSKLRILEG